MTAAEIEPPTSRGWMPALGVLAAVRVLVPLAALTASGHALPDLPRYDYGYRGDASGYYSTARALLSGLRWAGLPVVLVALAAAWWAWRRWWTARPDRRAPLLVGIVLLLSVAAAVVIAGGDRASVGAVGWPLLWAIPLAPFRLAGAAREGTAFPLGLALSLAANVATLVAVAYTGLWATRRRGVGLLAAALWALWPLLVGPVAGSDGWANGTWAADAGLALYTEPVSTALCTVAIALLLRPRPTATTYVLAGLAAGYATLTRPTNALLALLAVAVVLGRRGVRPTAWLVAAGAALVPPFLAFLPKRHGYALSGTGRTGVFTGFSADNFLSTFSASPLWGPRTLAVLVPPALVGLESVGLAGGVLLGGWVVLNSLFYAFVPMTAGAPRYLFAALPALLVLWSAGACRVVSAAAGLARARAVNPS